MATVIDRLAPQRIGDEQQALQQSLESQSLGGAVSATGDLGAGADVPARLAENPASQQLLRESVFTRSGQAPKAVQSSRDYLANQQAEAALAAGGGFNAAAERNAGAGGNIRNVGTEGGVGGVGGVGGGGTSEQSIRPSGAGDELKSLVESRYNALLQPQLSREELQKREYDAIQGQIDALNRIYDQKVREERRQGEGRLGQGRALNVVAGTQYSPFGTARTAEIERKNQEVINSINAERAAAIGALYNDAREGARKEAATQIEQLRLATDSFINGIAKSYDLNQQEQESLRNEAYRRAQLTGELGGQKTLDAQGQELQLRKFLLDETISLDQMQREKEAFDLQQQQALREGRQLFTDPVTGVVTSVNLLDPTDSYQVFQFSQPTSSIRGGGGVSGGGGSTGGTSNSGLSQGIISGAIRAFELAGGDTSNFSSDDFRNLGLNYQSITGSQSLTNPDTGEVLKLVQEGQATPEEGRAYLLGQ